jgi:hypothetical protein
VGGFSVTGGTPEALSPFSKEVFDVVAKYTKFPWPVLTAQCRRANVDPLHLDRASLEKIVDFVSDGVGFFTTPEKATQVRHELTLLARPRGESGRTAV